MYTLRICIRRNKENRFWKGFNIWTCTNNITKGSFTYNFQITGAKSNIPNIIMSEEKPKMKKNLFYNLTNFKFCFLTFLVCFWIPNIFFPIRIQEQVTKAFCFKSFFWPFTVLINCSSDLKKCSNSRTSTSNFKSSSRSLEQFFLTVGQNNFDNKIPFH